MRTEIDLLLGRCVCMYCTHRMPDANITDDNLKLAKDV